MVKIFDMEFFLIFLLDKTKKCNIIYIMKLDMTNPFGEIRGKLSLNKKEALEMFGFKMRDDARGVIFRRTRWGNLIIANWINPNDRKTKKQLKQRKLFKSLTHMVKHHKKDIIWPIWNKRASYTGHTLFMGTNLKKVGNNMNFENMLISLGEIEPPNLIYAKVENGILELKISNLNNQEIGIAVLTRKYKLYHFKPTHYPNPRKIKIKLIGRVKSPPLVYVYFKVGDKYSNSVSRRIKWQHILNKATDFTDSKQSI